MDPTDPRFSIPGLNSPDFFAANTPGFSMADLQGISGNSFAGATPRSPFQWQSFANSNGVGDFLGANAPLFSAGINALSQGVGIYAGLKNLSLAKKSFNLQRDAYRTNLANQTQSYNTQIGDRIAGRSYATEAERQAALKAAQLPTPGG